MKETLNEEHDISHTTNNYNNTENKRSEELQQLQHDDNLHNVVDSNNNPNMDKPYNLRKTRTKTSHGHFKKPFMITAYINIMKIKHIKNRVLCNTNEC